MLFLKVLNDFRLTGRIISLTLDNASLNNVSINLFFTNNVPQAGGHLFHHRCAYHIINLIMKSGLNVVSGHIDRIRYVIYYINSSNQRVNFFSRYCQTFDKEPKRFQIDMPVR